MSTILLIENDSDSRATLRTALSKAGHDLLEAADGEAGLAQFQATGADIVVTDVALPGKGGLEVMAQILVDQPHTTIFALGMPKPNQSVDLLEVAKLLGASRTFNKPVDVQKLVQAVGDEVGATG